MKLKLNFPEAQLISEVARAIPDISPQMARAIAVAFMDLAPTTPVKAVFNVENTHGTKRPSIAATRLALRGPERDEGFGTLSIGTADAGILAIAIKSHFDSRTLPDTAAALLSRLERSLVIASHPRQERGRGRPIIDFEEEEAPKVTLAAPKPAATEVATIVVLPTRSPLPPELAVLTYTVSETELLAAYQLLRGIRI